MIRSAMIYANSYRRVLKKREARLKREQNGLRSLIGGLVGGPALLKEWEHEWREKFGGEEKDEIEGEEAEPMSEDEDGDEDRGVDERERPVQRQCEPVDSRDQQERNRNTVGARELDLRRPDEAVSMYLECIPRR